MLHACWSNTILIILACSWPCHTKSTYYLFWAPTQQQEEVLRSCMHAADSVILARATAGLPPSSKELFHAFAVFCRKADQRRRTVLNTNNGARSCRSLGVNYCWQCNFYTVRAGAYKRDKNTYARTWGSKEGATYFRDSTVIIYVHVYMINLDWKHSMIKGELPEYCKGTFFCSSFIFANYASQVAVVLICLA